jgi:hypothetical protein
MVGWVSSKLPIVRKAGQFQSAVDSTLEGRREAGVDGAPLQKTNRAPNFSLF